MPLAAMPEANTTASESEVAGKPVPVVADAAVHKPSEEVHRFLWHLLWILGPGGILTVWNSYFTRKTRAGSSLEADNTQRKMEVE